MEWDAIAAVCAGAGLAGAGLGALASRSRREGFDAQRLTANEGKVMKLESEIADLERRVRHAQLNIAMLDSRTKGDVDDAE